MMRRMFKRLLRHLRRPPTLGRILTETAVLLVLHYVLVLLVYRAGLLEHLLSPGPDSRVALAITSMFLMLRIFVLVLLPGWVMARLWLLASRPRPPQHD